jgi:hypothetical protein
MILQPTLLCFGGGCDAAAARDVMASTKWTIALHHAGWPTGLSWCTPRRASLGFAYSMIPKSVQRFPEKIMLNKELKRDDDSRKCHPALAAIVWDPGAA